MPGSTSKVLRFEEEPQLAFAFLLLLPLSSLSPPMNRARGPANWPMPGRDPAGTRYSPLTQITPANVSQLKVAWVYHMRPAGSRAASTHPRISRW